MKNLIRKFIPSFLLSWYHFLLVFLGAVLYGFPSPKLEVIGVTGTNGKTTTTEMISKILEEAGYKVALLNSIRFKIGEKEWPNVLKITMPGRFFIQRFLRKAVNNKCQYAVLEVTSEGIKQYRHQFIDFEIAVLTNLTSEHIEAHGGFENYKKAKGKLFQATKGIHILNLDDENSRYFLQFPAETKIGYTLAKKNSKSPLLHSNELSAQIRGVRPERILSGPAGLNFKVQESEFNLKLLGEFNIYNALAAICVGLSQRIDLETSKKALEEIKGIPGRMELVISQPFEIFVDYAFTPNALEKVYETIKSKVKNRVSIYGSEVEEENEVLFARQKSKVICVLGACGGGRDKWKRPVLGEIAAKYCNEIIITNEDPYDEDPMEIIEQVAKGAENISVNQRKNQRESAVFKILDRREAIRKALTLAGAGDVVIITGKGCEPWICVANGKKIPWDDRKVVREEFQNLRLTKIATVK